MYSLYVLKLIKNKWYVGTCANFQDRLADHRNRRSCKWTTRYPMVHVAAKFHLPMLDCTRVENEVYMWAARRYGHENVRGGDVVCLQEPVPAYLLPEEFGGNRIVSWG